MQPNQLWEVAMQSTEESETKGTGLFCFIFLSHWGRFFLDIQAS